MIKCLNLKKVYPLKSASGYAALKGINIEIRKGEFAAVCGPSGCGKSTLLNILGFLDIPTEGKYFFMGEDASSFSDSKRSFLRREKAGFVFQSFNLLPKLSVIENAMLPLLYLGVSRKEAHKKAYSLLERVGLSSKSENDIMELSGGERQRVGLARALSNDPEILLADEPTGNLDSENSLQVLDLLTEINKERKMTVIMVTHDMKLAARAERIIKIKDGEIQE